MKCPKCKSENVSIQMVTESKLATKHRSIIWWIFVGWWLVPIKWVIFFVPALFLKIFGGKRYKLKTKKVKMGVCQNCGHSWKI